MNKKNTIFLISGPTGVGKDTVIKTLNESNSNIKNIVTITTRKIRVNEINNKDYIFVNKKEFENLIKKNKLIEWSEVYGNFYGVPKDQIDKNLKNQNKIIIKTDIQGVKKLKQKFINATTIFIMPPDVRTLLNRLKSRKTDSVEDITKRSNIAIKEIEEKKMFDHIIINKDGDLINTINQIKKIINETKQALNISGKNIFLPLRFGLIGELHGPDLFTIIDIIGIKESINRIKSKL